MRTKLLPVLILSLAYWVGGCGSSTGPGATGGSGGVASSTQDTGSGAAGSGGSSSPLSSSTPTGGVPVGGSSSVVTSSVATGGSPVGGTSAKGGTSSATPTTTIPTGGSTAVGGTSSVVRTSAGSAAGSTRTGGAPRGGTTATGGTATGGVPTGGTATSGTPPSTGAVDCSAVMPTSGGTQHCGSYRTGKAGTLAWELWSNSYNSNACITYYSTPAFSAKWSNNSDFLARVGIEWGGKSIATLGTITADFTVKKSGDSGYSYIGIYGWATQPCTEYYIIDDSMRSMPFNPWNMTQKGSATIDGEVYKFYSGSSGGTGGSRCTTPFTQNWSVRQKARSCGTITISQHFAEWKKAGMAMDNILEAKVLVESGGGTGSVEFPVANVKAVAN
jgi:endo-1,4-beta-xylanase